MDKTLKNILINSTVAFVSAFFITTFIHEGGHFISYLIFGAGPTLFHNHVYIPDQQLGIHINIISALAGPLSSLLQGIILAVVIPRRREGRVIDLLFLWLSLLGFVNFFGYLMMTPLSSAGDTGKVAELMGMSYVYRILVAVAGFALLIFVILRTGKHFADFIPAESGERERKKYVYHVMFFPIIIGSLVNTLFAFPIPVLLSAIYPATSSFVIMSSFGAIMKSPDSIGHKTKIEERLSRSLLLLAVLGMLLNRLLTNGLSIHN
jgi:hypothetical protein